MCLFGQAQALHIKWNLSLSLHTFSGCPIICLIGWWGLFRLCFSAGHWSVFTHTLKKISIHVCFWLGKTQLQLIVISFATKNISRTLLFFTWSATIARIIWVRVFPHTHKHDLLRSQLKLENTRTYTSIYLVHLHTIRHSPFAFMLYYCTVLLPLSI